MPLPLIISFYTKNTPYQEEVENLADSCRQFGLENDIEGIESHGSWELNCAYKPFYILHKLKQHRRAVLWVDADAVFMQRPKQIPAFEADLAVRINEDCAADHPSKVMSGTIFVHWTEAAQELIRLWIHESQKLLLHKERTEEFWDQEALRNAIFTAPHTARVVPLPPEYTKIFDRPSDVPPVIEHYQASRRFKKLKM